MNRNEIQSKVIEIITHTATIDPANISADTKIADLDIDSMSGLQIITQAESAFSVRLANEAFPIIATVKDLVDAIEKALKE